MKRAPSVQALLLALTAAVLLLVAAGQLVFGSFFARPFFVQQQKEQLETQFDLLADDYSDDPRELYALLRTGEDTQNIRAAVFDQFGRMLYSTRPTEEGAAPPMPNLNGLRFSRVPEAEEIGSGSDAQISLAGELTYRGQPRYIVLWIMAGSVDGSIAMVNRASVYIVLGVLVVGGIAGVLLARRLSRPLREIQEVSQRVAALDFSARADEAAPIREVAGLACSINQMAAHLRQTIEELHAANARLQEDVDRQKQLEKMRREFVANVSHEMKTPLCLLQMYAENLKNNVAGIDKDYYCETIIDEAGRLSEMVGGMLDLSAAENGMGTMELVPMDLGALCRDILERMAPVLAHCRVQTSLEGDFPVRGDAKFLKMAVKNYLSNAVSHTTEGGVIRVSLAHVGQMVQFTVENQGAQIPPDQMVRVWDSFYKVDEARVRSDSVHAGLGLAIVQAVITRHGGAVAVQNRKDGVAFLFALPEEK